MGATLMAKRPPNNVTRLHELDSILNLVVMARVATHKLRQMEDDKALLHSLSKLHNELATASVLVTGMRNELLGILYDHDVFDVPEGS